MKVLCFYMGMLYPSTVFNPFEDIDAFDISRTNYDQLLSGEVSPTLLKPDAEQREPLDIDIATLLLQSVSTAIMHFERPPKKYRGSSRMIGANYTDGHSEGQDLIVIQDASKPEEGQWELRTDLPDRTIYRRRLMGKRPYPFEKTPTNPLKIRKYYIHVGQPDEAIQSFKDEGYLFEDSFRRGKGWL